MSQSPACSACTEPQIALSAPIFIWGTTNLASQHGGTRLDRLVAPQALLDESPSPVHDLAACLCLDWASSLTWGRLTPNPLHSLLLVLHSIVDDTGMLHAIGPPESAWRTAERSLSHFLAKGFQPPSVFAPGPGALGSVMAGLSFRDLRD